MSFTSDHVVKTGFRSGTGPIFMSSLNCNGTETSLLDCDFFSTTDIQNCDHSMDIGVHCECKQN